MNRKNKYNKRAHDEQKEKKTNRFKDRPLCWASTKQWKHFIVVSNERLFATYFSFSEFLLEIMLIIDCHTHTQVEWKKKRSATLYSISDYYNNELI